MVWWIRASSGVWHSARAIAQLTGRGFAVTALEKYAACPYRFYLATVVGLSARKQAVAVEELDAATRGLIIHELLRSASVALQERQLVLARFGFRGGEASAPAHGRCAAEPVA